MKRWDKASCDEWFDQIQEPLRKLTAHKMMRRGMSLDHLDDVFQEVMSRLLEKVEQGGAPFDGDFEAPLEEGKLKDHIASAISNLIDGVVRPEMQRAKSQAEFFANAELRELEEFEHQPITNVQDEVMDRLRTLTEKIRMHLLAIGKRDKDMDEAEIRQAGKAIGLSDAEIDEVVQAEANDTLTPRERKQRERARQTARAAVGPDLLRRALMTLTAILVSSTLLVATVPEAREPVWSPEPGDVEVIPLPEPIESTWLESPSLAVGGLQGSALRGPIDHQMRFDLGAHPLTAMSSKAELIGGDLGLRDHQMRFHQMG